PSTPPSCPDRRVTFALFGLKLVEPEECHVGAGAARAQRGAGRPGRALMRSDSVVAADEIRRSARFAAVIEMAWGRLVSLGVWFPPTKLNTLGTAAERVEHHLGRARVHRIVSIEPAHGIECAIHVVDTIINPDLIAIPDPIFGHGLICPPHSFEQSGPSSRSAGNYDHVAPAPLTQPER
ncbi:MAG: hypothetical protein ACREDY_20255, partial [Bradyrhizobium sp.]